MSDRLFGLRLFVRVAHTGSFSRAGREFGLSQPSASRSGRCLSPGRGAEQQSTLVEHLSLGERSDEVRVRGRGGTALHRHHSDVHQALRLPSPRATGAAVPSPRAAGAASPHGRGVGASRLATRFPTRVPSPEPVVPLAMRDR